MIEDDAGDAFLVEELIVEANASIELLVATSMRQALQHLDEVSAVLLDLGLPGATGLAGLQSIKQKRPDLPVVVLTGLKDEALGVAAIDAGADDFLVKGRIDGELLVRAMRYAMDRGSLQRQLVDLRTAQADLHRTEHRSQIGRLPDVDQSSCLLIGTSHYDDPVMYPNLPAVEHNLHRLAAVLTDPDLGGFAADRVHIEHNPTQAIGKRLADISEQTKDVLLVYYAGHGVVDEDGELYYGLPTIRAGQVWCTALPHQWIRRAMVNSSATARVLILDSCFSGRAIEAMTDPQSTVSGQLEISGAYTLTATSGNSVARASDGDLYTAFTGELLNLLGEGLPGEGPLLHVTALYSPLVNALLAKNHPRPLQRGTGTIGNLALTRNAAHERSRTE